MDLHEYLKNPFKVWEPVCDEFCNAQNTTGKIVRNNHGIFVSKGHLSSGFIEFDSSKPYMLFNEDNNQFSGCFKSGNYMCNPDTCYVLVEKEPSRELIAAALDGRDIDHEIACFEEKLAKEAGLVVVYGYSDDIAVFVGAINDEVSCYDGGEIYIDKSGIMQEPDLLNSCNGCPYFQKAKEDGKLIKAVWGNNGISWTYETTIPHSTFEIMEDGEVYCRGIVFKLSDLES